MSIRHSTADLFHNSVTAWFVLACSILVTMLGWFIASEYAQRRALDRFDFQVEAARRAITKRMQEYEQVLRGGVGLFRASDEVTRDDWRHYVETLQIDTNWPGIQGIGFSRMFAPVELPAHVAAVRAGGFPEYDVSPAGVRDQYSAIVYLEPFDWRNRRAFGYDMFSEPVRRAAMETARDTGRAAVSGRVTLVQETEQDVQAGFLMYLPLYGSDLPTETREQRRAALLGFVYSPFRIDDLLRGILGHVTPSLDFNLYDGVGTTSGSLLYDSDKAERTGSGRARRAKPHYATTRQIELSGRTWSVEFHSQPEFERQMDSSQPQIIAFGGLTLDLLLFAIIWSLSGQQQRVRRQVTAITRELHQSEARYRSVVDHVKEVIFQTDADGRWTFLNPAWEEISGLSVRESRGRDYLEFIHPEARDAHRELFRPLLERREESNRREVRCLRRDGSERWVEVHARATLNETGDRVLGTSGVVTDISDRKRAEDEIRAFNLRLEQRVAERTAELQAAEEKLRLAASVFHNSSEGVFVTDTRATILSVNPAFTEITGYSEAEAVGRKPSLLRSARHGPDFYQTMWRTLNTTGIWQGEIWNRRKSGEAFLEWLTINRIDDDEGSPNRYVAVFHDVTESRRKDERIRHLAFHDALTGLPNRALMHDRLRHAVARARRENVRLAVMFFDLDHFKGINDGLGHDVGDLLLQEVAQRIQARLRRMDTAARMGGDEFVILMEDLQQPSDCANLAESILAEIARPMVLRGHSVQVGTSMGMAFFPEDGDDPVQLMKHADMAMYAAKSAGRNTYRFFHQKMLEQTSGRLKLEMDLRRAVANGELELHFQPKVALLDRRCVGLEALVRWRHPERGLVPPAEFIPVAEECGLIGELGHWVLQESCRQAAAWRGQGLGEIPIAVNVSSRQLDKDDLDRHVDALTAANGISPAQIEVELTESVVMANPEQVIDLFTRLRRLGTRVPIDDFGTGYSSLAYLRRLPIDQLKIDRSFVNDLERDDEDVQVVKTILALSHSLSLTAVAEGVETEEQAERLRSLGCDTAQGYLYARPLPAPELEAWWRTGRPQAGQDAGAGSSPPASVAW